MRCSALKKKISDFLVVSDLDGTLLTSHYEIPQRNVEAIRRFCANGGRFSIATGRSISSARYYAETLKLTAPAIVCNGSVLYDYQSEKIIDSRYLPKAAESYCYTMLKSFPEAGAEAFCDNDIWVIQPSELIEKHEKAEGFTFLRAKDFTAPSGWNKAILASGTDVVARMEQYVSDNPCEGAYFVKSSPTYFEIMPDKINKGTGLNMLAKHLKIDMASTAAVGDYYNDVDMIKAAGIGAASGNAPDDIKKQADIVVCSYQNGAVADVIEYIEKLCK